MSRFKRKIVVYLLCMCTFIVASGVSIFAIEQKTNVDNLEPLGCSIPRQVGTASDEEFITLIEKEYSINRNDDNVYIQYNANGTTSIAIIENENSITVLSSPTQEQIETFENLNKNRSIPLWTALVWLFRAYKIGTAIKTGCEVIEGVSGEDVCGYISTAVINNLVEAGTRKRFKVIRYLEKLSCPYPPSSQQCNEPPYAYVRTTYQAY